MDLHFLLLIFFACFLILSQNGVEGSNWELSEGEELELERQLKLLNKPAIKTIHTEYGAIYDCIDFYQQPAFDHPKLKNKRFHYEMESVSSRNQTRDRVTSKFISDIDMEGEECPVGTVLIKGVTKEDLIKHKYAEKRRRVIPLQNNFHYAIARTKVKLGSYAGAGATLAIYNPQVSGRAYSAARLKIQNGDDSIEVGWRVDQWLNGDNKTHIYVYTESDKSCCYNTRCPGFVVTSRKIAVDGVFTTISKRGGPIYTFQVDIVRDVKGNWRLRVGPWDRIQLGYWPKDIFADDGLAELASYIDLGGEVYSEPNMPSPPMGSWYTPNNNTKETAYFKKVTYRNEQGVKADAEGLEPYADVVAYKVIDIEKVNNNLRHVIFYGGAGGWVE